MEKRDCIIIGAGIAGMTAALYLKRFIAIIFYNLVIIDPKYIGY